MNRSRPAASDGRAGADEEQSALLAAAELPGAGVGRAEADEVATGIWEEINGRNLRENILPTRSRADLILRKGPDHAVERIWLRKL